jgi:hypothetical protein
VFVDGIDQRQARFADGLMLPFNLTESAAANPILRFDAKTFWGFNYDSGLVSESGQTPTFVNGIDLMGRNNRAARQTRFVNGGDMMETSLPVDLFSDVQLLDVGGQQVQALVDLNNFDDRDDIDAETAALRVRNRATNISLIIGKDASPFGFRDIQPQGLTQARVLVGALDLQNNNTQQAKLRIPIDKFWTSYVALENPVTDDILPATGFPGTLEKHLRWPTLSTNLTWQDGGNIAQFSGLVRNIGFNTPANDREFKTAWGLSAVTRVLCDDDKTAWYAGVTGGEGIGQYIAGLDIAAIATPTSIDLVESYSAVFGVSHDWDCAEWECGEIFKCRLNAAYGYAFNRVGQQQLATGNRQLHHAWVNIIKRIGDRIVTGVEYQYGYREIASGDAGEDHRLTFMVGIRTAPAANAKAVTPKAVSQIAPRTLVKGPDGNPILGADGKPILGLDGKPKLAPATTEMVLPVSPDSLNGTPLGSDVQLAPFQQRL